MVGGRSRGPGASERAEVAKHVGPGSGSSGSIWQSWEGDRSVSSRPVLKPWSDVGWRAWRSTN